MSFAVVKRFGFSLSLILLVSSLAIAQRSYDDNSNQQSAPATVNITQGPIVQYADDQFAVITWTTDHPFVSRIFYGKDASNLNQISEDVRSQSLRHQINLRNLQPSTTYYFRIDAGQGTAAAASTDSLNGFQTTALGANPIRNQAPFKGAVQGCHRTPRTSVQPEAKHPLLLPVRRALEPTHRELHDRHRWSSAFVRSKAAG